MLPDVEMYGLRVPGVGLVAVAALGMLFGWRGLIGGLILGEGLVAVRQTWHAPCTAAAQLWQCTALLASQLLLLITAWSLRPATTASM
jgi:hypothetical protein